MSEDGTKQIQGQVICRALGSNVTVAADNDARFLAYVVQVTFTKRLKERKCLLPLLQAAFVNLPVRHVLVLACTKSIQVEKLHRSSRPGAKRVQSMPCRSTNPMEQRISILIHSIRINPTERVGIGLAIRNV